MAEINFPDSPTLNDTYVVGNITYLWNGTRWTSTVGMTEVEVIQGEFEVRFIDIDGTILKTDWVDSGNAATPPTCSDVPCNTNTLSKIYVPDASLAAYKAATNWVAYANQIFAISTM